MGKRKDAARASDSTERVNKPEQPETLAAAGEPPANPLPGVESPDLVPAQIIRVAPPVPAAESTSAARIDPPADLVATPVVSDVVTVSFADAAAEAAAANTDAVRRKSAIAAYLRARRFLPLAATIAIAAAVGAMSGALATGGISRLLGADDDARIATLQENRLLKDTITRVAADVGALKTDIESSARTASAQFARLGERLDRSDRAQAESSGKLARLTDQLDRHGPATVAAAPAPAVTASAPPSAAAADSLVTGSITSAPPQLHAPATRPAGQPIVEGWALRSVQNGAALIQGRIGLVEVEPGDSLPGLGRIEAIRRLDGRWVVVTNRGLIIAR